MAFAPTFTGFNGISAGYPTVSGGFPAGYSAGYPAVGGFGGFGGFPGAASYVGEVHNPAIVSQPYIGEQVIGYGSQILEADIPVLSYQHVAVEQPIVYEQPVVYEVPQVVDVVQPVVQPVVYAPPPPPPRQRVSIVARSRDPRAQAAANELLNRFRGVSVAHPGDVQRLLDNSARTLSRALPNPVVA